MYQIGSLVEMKKPHSLYHQSNRKKANEWEVTVLELTLRFVVRIVIMWL